MAKIKYNYDAVISFLKKNGPKSASEISRYVFGFGHEKRNTMYSILIRLQKRELVFVVDEDAKPKLWTADVEDIFPKNEEQAEEKNRLLFEKEYVPENKPCYMGPRGFVHVFNTGEYTCNCGERTCETMEGKYVGNSFLYGNMK
jgi:hypothetical protein